MRLIALLLALMPFSGTYTLVAYAKPGTHTASTVPPELKGLKLTIRDDGSVTMGDQEAECIVNTADSTAIITDGRDLMRARFSHDTLVTRVPGGGPIFYWKRT